MFYCIVLFIIIEMSYQLVGYYFDFENLFVYEYILLICNWGILGCVYLMCLCFIV